MKNLFGKSGNNKNEDGSIYKQVIDNIPINIIIADLDGIITKVNQSSIDTLKPLEHLLPIKIDEIVGSSYDVFHKVPEHQRKLLADPNNLPHQAVISLGDEKLDLLVTAIYDDKQNYVGPMVTWSVITEKLKLEEESNRYEQIIENLPLNVILADKDSKITSMNPASVKTLKSIEHLLPVKVDQILGNSYDVFHKAPEHQRKLLADPSNLPHQAVISVGDEFLDLLVSPIYDKNGEYKGPMLTWSVITDKIKTEKRDEMVKQQLISSISTLTNSTQGLTNSSDELTTSVSSLTHNSHEVKQFMNDVSAAAQELSSSIKEISTRTFQATDLTKESVEQINSTQRVINALNEQSTEIEIIVKTINEIASQTNLLALNATIEAARAGDVGKGFAVVAGEIKELASRTGQSTQEIREKVSAIQEATTQALASVKVVVDSIQEVNNSNTTIASAIEEQTAVTQEIEKSMEKSNRNLDEMLGIISVVESNATNNTQKVTDINHVTSELSSLTNS